MWRIFEPCGVQEEHEIPRRIVGTYGAEVAVTCTALRTMMQHAVACPGLLAGVSPGPCPCPAGGFCVRACLQEGFPRV